MKKMMIIAAFVSAMLMPAQIMAQNNQRNNRKPVAARVENNRKGGQRKDMHIQNGKHSPVVSHKPVAVHNYKPAHKPVVVHHQQPTPPPVVVHHPAPRPVIHSHCSSDVAGVAAVAIGVAGLISLLAD